jgi:ATP-binding cassette subfamily F protein uup
MNILTMKGISKAFTDKVLFKQADFSINEQDKIGIIGVNGSGKSTLLKILAGIEEADEGDYAKVRNCHINYLPQNPIFDPKETIYDYVITKNMTGDNAWSIEGEAKMILNKLGFTEYDILIEKLSGGQRKKVALAGALLSSCDVLVLDEPTNHLDNDMTEWLETYLNSYKGALVMVTHDRYFLDLICNCIVEIDKGECYRYDTNYEGYLNLKAIREEMQRSTMAKHANILTKEIAWMQRGARARSTKQKAHIARYEALRDEKPIAVDEQIELIDMQMVRLGKKTIELHDISNGYGELLLFHAFTYIFLKKDRIGIIGPNGCGKTTLLKTMLGKIPSKTGTIEIGETVRIGYFAQENDHFDEEMRVIDYISESHEKHRPVGAPSHASKMLEQFLFDATIQYAKIGKLSGGEKRRLYLLKVLLEMPNVLVLDEPTNDLDISTLRILEDYLDSFSGIVIVVSHDRYFLDRVVNRLMVFEEGSIRQYEGKYTDYFMERKLAMEENTWLEDKNEKENISTAEEYKKSKERIPKKLKFTFKEEQEYKTIEEIIEKLEEEIALIDQEIPKVATDFMKLKEFTDKREKLEAMLEEKMERYVYLEELAEKIRAQGNLI